MLPIPAIRGTYGDRLATYVTQISPDRITAVLGHDPRASKWKHMREELRNLYKMVQRKTESKRADSIEAYVENRFSPDAITIGMFPAISVAVQKAMIFTPSAPGSSLGTLHLDISPELIRMLIDGMARVAAPLNLIDVAETPEEKEAVKAILKNFAFACTIYAPREGQRDLSWNEMGQMFHDVNFKAVLVPKAKAIGLDTSDPYITLGNKLGEAKAFAGLVEHAASLGKKSSAIITQTLLVRLVRGACEGLKFQESNLDFASNPNLTGANAAATLRALDDFFDGLATRLGPDKWKDRTSLHLSSPGWQALGVIFNDCHFVAKMDQTQTDVVLAKLAALDWSRSNPTWINTGVVKYDLDPKTGQAFVEDGKPKVILGGAGRDNRQAMIDHLRATAGIVVKSEPLAVAAE